MESHQEQAINQIREKIRKTQPDNPMLWGWRSYSQTDEDGIIRHCLEKAFSSIDHDNTFVEIGCGDGKENNSHQLLLDGYRGVWIDGAHQNIQSIEKSLGAKLFGQLAVIESFVQKNDWGLARRCKSFLSTASIDFLSIDTDGNDQAIAMPFVSVLDPKLICVEYNAKFRPPTRLQLEYNPGHQWMCDDYYGSSLQSWCDFFDVHGYTLVSCNLSGVNAFFIRNDLSKHFAAYSPSEVFMPARFWTAGRESGHKATRKWLRQILKNDAHLPINADASLVETKDFYIYAHSNDYLTCELERNGHYHQDSVTEVTRFLEKNYHFDPDSFVNIGANIGLYAIHALKSGCYRFCTAVEPEQKNFQLLEANFRFNRLEQFTTLINAAISNYDGAATLEICLENSGDHRIRCQQATPWLIAEVELESQRETQTTRTMKLETLLAAHSKTCSASRSLIWIDSQGHEAHILEGADFYLREGDFQFIVTEFWPYGIERSGKTKSDLFKIILNCREIFEISTTSQGERIRPTTLERLHTIYDECLANTRKGHHPHCDILLRF